MQIKGPIASVLSLAALITYSYGIYDSTVTVVTYTSRVIEKSLGNDPDILFMTNRTGFILHPFAYYLQKTVTGRDAC
jgi:hypothetical protein